MTREQIIEKEYELLLRRHNKSAKVKLKIANLCIPEDIIDILSQNKKRTNEQEKALQRFRKNALKQLSEVSDQIRKERLEKARKTREANLEKDPRYVKHFGVWINKALPSSQISREHYAKINPRSSVYSFVDVKYNFANKKDSPIFWDEEKHAVFYTEEYCVAWQKKCLENFDINMYNFSQLDYQTFNAFLEKFAKNRKFKQVFSFDDPVCTEEMWETTEIEGFVYIMVLDKYKQIYIGITNNTVQDRVKQHWRNTRAFDRLIFGSDNTSVLSIDSFGPLDTTRLYVKPYYKKLKTPLEAYEYKCIKAFDSKYLLNRLR